MSKTIGAAECLLAINLAFVIPAGLEYGAMIGEMDPTLDDDVVYARGSKPEIDAAVIAQYPGRAVYYLAKGRLSTTYPAP